MYQDPRSPDVAVENHGTIFLVRPLSDYAADWLESNVLDLNPEAQLFGGALVVEHQFIRELVHGLRADGLKVS